MVYIVEIRPKHSCLCIAGTLQRGMCWSLQSTAWCLETLVCHDTWRTAPTIKVMKHLHSHITQLFCEMERLVTILIIYIKIAFTLVIHRMKNMNSQTLHLEKDQSALNKFSCCLYFTTICWWHLVKALISLACSAG